MTYIEGVEVINWNPPQNRYMRHLNVFSACPLVPRINNFGDMLGPQIVELLLGHDRRTKDILRINKTTKQQSRLLTVGSVLHLARNGDTVWGSGINGKVFPYQYTWDSLDFRAVRGPLTAQWIRDNRRGIPPSVFGDPALLLFRVGYPRPDRNPVKYATFIPNLNDEKAWCRTRGSDVISPRSSVEVILEAISEVDIVITSSLHGLILSELLGVPTRLVHSSTETEFKYLDYLAGTGRQEIKWYSDIESAFERDHDPDDSLDPLRYWNPEPLLSAFPFDLWGRTI